MAETISVPTDENRAERSAGWLIAVTTFLVIAFVAHHPMAAIHGEAGALEAIDRIRSMDQIVHGALIALLLAFVVGYAGLARHIGFSNPAASGGLLVYFAGSLAAIGAGVLDGFVVPDVAHRFMGGPEADQHIAFDMIVYSGLAIQSLTKLGLILIAVGTLIWATALVRRRGMARIVGVIGIIAGACPAIWLMGGSIVLEPRTLVALLLVQSAWNVAVAALLLHNGRIGRS